MADQKKELVFTFKVDQQSLNSLKTAIKSITEDMQKLIQTAAGISRLGGSAPAVGGGGTYGAQAIKTATASPGQASAGLGGVFNTAASSATNAANAIRSATRSMETDIQSVMRALGQTPSSAGLFSQPVRMGTQLSNLVQPGLSMGQRPSGSMVLSGGPGPWGGGGGMGQPAVGAGISSGPPPPAANAWGTIGPSGGRGWLKTGAMAYAALGFGLDEAMAGYRLQPWQEQAKANIAERNIRRVVGGDYSYLYAARTMNGEQRANMAGEVGTAAWIQAGKEGLQQSLVNGSGLIGKFLSGGGGGNEAAPGIAGPLTMSSMNIAMTKNVEKHIEAARAKNIMENIAGERFQGTLGTSIAAQRMGMVDPTSTTGERNRHDFAQFQADLEREGYSPGEAIGAKQSLMAAGGTRFAGSHYKAAMAASAAGYGGFGGMAGLAARTGGGDAFAYGAVGGGIDKNAGIQMGMGILGTGFDVRGTTSGLGLLGAMQAGGGFSGGAGDFNAVARLAAGSGLMNAQLSGGLDPYQRGRNFVSAIDIKPGAGFYAQDALSNGMDLKQMADIMMGGSTASMRAHGITKGDVSKQFGSTVSSTFDRFVDQGGSDPMSAAIRQYRASGKELPEYLKSLSTKTGARQAAIENLGVFAGEQMGEGAEAGIGYMQIAGGMGSKARTGGIGSKLTGLEATAAKAQADITSALGNTLGIMAKEYAGAMDSAKSQILAQVSWGTKLDTSAQDFIKVLSGLTDAMIDQLDRFNPGQGDLYRSMLGISKASAKQEAKAQDRAVQKAMGQK